MQQSQPGLGVMIRHLAGNESSVQAYRGALGKTIAEATLEDSVLTLQFADGTGIAFKDEGQSCCEHRYMRTDDELVSFFGATFDGAEIKEAPPVEGEYGSHEVQFLEIRTSKGALTMASHNEHNGYYGGFAIEVSAVTAEA